MLEKFQGTKGDITLPSLQSRGWSSPHPVDISSDALSAVIGRAGNRVLQEEHSSVLSPAWGQQQEGLPDRVTSKLRPEAESR